MSSPGFRSIPKRLFAGPLIRWVFLGFAVSYFIFFIGPIFLATNVMQFFPYVPAAEHIGIDLKQTLSFSQYWLATDSIPYVRSNTYPPLASLLFVPLIGLKFSVAYRILTILSVLSYGFLALVLPGWLIRGDQPSSLPGVLCVAGLLSYAFQFELERGQFDVIAILPALLAIWIYHRHHSRRWAAYVLFSLSVQLKLYPLVFVLVFVNDWRDWRNNLRRVLFLVLANLALLLAFGQDIFRSFTNAAKVAALDPYIWIGNHSIRSGLTLAFELASRHGWTGWDRHSGLMEAILYGLVAACIILMIVRAYKLGSVAFPAHLLMASALAALLLTPVSHDYRLNILATPAAALLLEETGRKETSRLLLSALRSLLIFVFSFAYSSTFFSFVQKPFWFANNLPALLMMLLAATALACLPEPGRIEVSG
jgi:hypothetical protein